MLGKMRQRLRLRYLRLQFIQRVLPLYLRPKSPAPLVRLGSGYGGWWVPVRLATHGTVAYCAGAGLDITFDRELLRRGCRVTTFDPTPDSIAHVHGEAIDDQAFRFVPIGWWDSDTTLDFWEPLRAGKVSHSAVIKKNDRIGFSAPVKPVHQLMRELGDDQVDMIKMDIEGAEYRVIDSLLEHGPRPTALCVEFDQPQPIKKTIGAVRALAGAGYQLAKVEKLNYTFVRN